MAISAALENAIRNREAHESEFSKTYFTPGGTFMIATPGVWNDNGQDKDVIAIGYYGEVIPLVFSVDPNFLSEVTAAAK